MLELLAFDPAWWALGGTIFGGLGLKSAQKLLSNRYNTVPEEATPILPESCNMFVTHVFERRLVESGIIEETDMTICDKLVCPECNPIQNAIAEKARQARAVARAEERARLAEAERQRIDSMTDADRDWYKKKMLQKYGWETPMYNGTRPKANAVYWRPELRAAAAANAALQEAEVRPKANAVSTTATLRCEDCYTSYETIDVKLDGELVSTYNIPGCNCHDSGGSRMKRHEDPFKEDLIQMMLNNNSTWDMGPS